MPEPIHTYIVDDEPIVLKTIGKLLALENYAVETFSSAEDFSTKMETDAPYILIVDKNLPGISGLDLIDQQRRAGHDFEAIMITGYADMDSAIEAVRLGLYSYIRKPFDFDQLLTDIAGATAQLRTRQFKQHIDGSLLEEILEPLSSAGTQCASVRRALQEKKLPDDANQNLRSTSSILRAIGNMVRDHIIQENLKKTLSEIKLCPVALLQSLRHVIQELRGNSVEESMPPIWLETSEEIMVKSQPIMMHGLFTYLLELALTNAALNESIVIDIAKNESAVTVHFVVQNNKGKHLEGDGPEKLTLCQRLAHALRGDLTVSPYIDSSGLDFALTLKRSEEGPASD